MNSFVAAAIDVAVVLVFVLIGRTSHDESNALLGVVITAAPFLMALAASWLVVLLLGRDPRTVPTGLLVWLGTWAGGLMLRWLIFDGGVAGGFVLVAGGFLLLGMVGWRALVRVFRRAPE